MNLTAVAEALAVHPSNASRAVDRLITADLLDRQDAPHDRRSLTLTLTPAGKQLVDRQRAPQSSDACGPRTNDT